MLPKPNKMDGYMSNEMELAVKAYIETALRIADDMYSNIDGVTPDSAKLFAIITSLKNALAIFNEN
jgi:hypothetical protein